MFYVRLISSLKFRESLRALMKTISCNIFIQFYYRPLKEFFPLYSCRLLLFIISPFLVFLARKRI
jgi:hypothetical protein